jgi:hypothetical protein
VLPTSSLVVRSSVIPSFVLLFSPGDRHESDSVGHEHHVRQREVLEPQLDHLPRRRAREELFLRRDAAMERPRGVGCNPHHLPEGFRVRVSFLRDLLPPGRSPGRTPLDSTRRIANSGRFRPTNGVL